MKKIILIALITIFNNAKSETVSVGSGANCTYNNIYAALNSIDRGESIEIELNKLSIEDYILPASLTIIDRNVTIRGGFSGCGSSIDYSSISRINLDEGVFSPTIRIMSFATPTPAVVNLERILINGGHAAEGAGIRISGDNDVNIIDSQIVSNRANYGGGIYIDGKKGAKLKLLNSRVASNISDQWGGGLYCVDANITLAETDISHNIAQVHGGGLFLNNCDLNSIDIGDINIKDNRADLEMDTSQDPIYIENPAYRTSSGGGIFAYNGSNINLGSENTSIYFLNNVAFKEDRYHDLYGEGGALRARDNNTNINLVNTHFIGNLASRGGAISLSNSIFNMTSLGSNCTQTIESNCSTMIENTAVGGDLGFFGCVSRKGNIGGQGGAIWSNGGVDINLNGVLVKGNKVTRTDGCGVESVIRPHEAAAFYVGYGVDFNFLNSILTDTTKSIDGSDDDAEAVKVYGKFSAVHSTITGNDDGFEAIVRAGSDQAEIEFVNSIVVESQDLYDTDEFIPQIRSVCSVVSSISELVNPNGPASISSDTVETSNAGFVNAGAQDFHLQSNSIAIDLCNGEGLQDRGLTGLLINDFDGGNRPVIGNGTNASHSFDAGAYENQMGNSLQDIDLAVSISDGGYNYGLNQQFGYTVLLENLSDVPVTGVGLKIALDPQITLPGTIIVSPQNWNCTQANHIITCMALQTVAANNTYPSSILLAYAGFSNPTVITSTATSLTGNYYIDSNDSNNIDTEVTSIAVNSDVGVDTVNIPANMNPAQSAELTFAFENFGTDSSVNAVFSIKLDHVDADISVVSTPDFWNCFTYQDPNDALKPRMDCYYPNYFPVSRKEFTILAIPASGTPAAGETFNVVLNASTASNDDNMQNNSLLVEVPLVPISDTIFKSSF